MSLKLWNKMRNMKLEQMEKMKLNHEHFSNTESSCDLF